MFLISVNYLIIILSNLLKVVTIQSYSEFITDVEAFEFLQFSGLHSYWPVLACSVVSGHHLALGSTRPVSHLCFQWPDGTSSGVVKKLAFTGVEYKCCSAECFDCVYQAYGTYEKIGNRIFRFSEKLRIFSYLSFNFRVNYISTIVVRAKNYFLAWAEHQTGGWTEP
jgi:hypothetical protein